MPLIKILIKDLKRPVLISIHFYILICSNTCKIPDALNILSILNRTSKSLILK